MRKHALILAYIIVGSVTTFAQAETNIKVIEYDDVNHICIKSNPKVKENFEKELTQQLNDMNIKTMGLAGAFAGECEYELHYTANWSWQVALYVSYIELKVIRNRSIVGYATYSTRDSITPIGKLGSTAARISELLEAMFVNHRLKEKGVKRV